MRNIILFGPAGAGKTTVAKMIIEILKNKDVGAVKASQGAKIKEICAELKYNSDKDDRELQQAVGQELRKIFGIDVWCHYLNNYVDLAKVGSLLNTECFMIIDDGRQHNEFDFWGKQGFIQVGIIADFETRVKRLLDRDGYDQRDRLNFENEITADDIAREKCRYVIRNEGTLDELRELVGQFLEMVAEVERGEWDE